MNNLNKPFFHALAAAAYITGIILVINSFEKMFSDKPDTILAPITMLSLLVLSVLVMWFLFFYEPLRRFMRGDKEGALKFLAQEVGFFACFVALFVVLLFVF